MYGVHIQGRAGTISGYAPFTLAAEVFLSPTIAPTPATTNGSNPIEVAIFTTPAVPLGTNGALALGTNASVAALRGGSANAVDVAFVTLSAAGSRLEAILDRDALALPGGRSASFIAYGVASGAVEQIVAGTVTLQADGSGSLSGTILLAGSSGTQYSATLSGSRTQ